MTAQKGPTTKLATHTNEELYYRDDGLVGEVIARAHEDDDRVAAALGLQLGGLNRYGGIEKVKPLLNPSGRAADQTGVQAILKASQRCALLWLGISGLVALLA